MFATVVHRVRSRDAALAVVAVQEHLRSAGDANNFFDALCVLCYETGVRAALVGEDDFRRRDRDARRHLDELREERDVLAFTKDLRFSWLFRSVYGIRKHELSMYMKLKDRYRSYVDGPERERNFLLATRDLVAKVTDTPGWDPEVFDAKRYLAARDTVIDLLLRHTSPETFPFTTVGPEVTDSLFFDLGGDGPAHYILSSVHM